MRLIRTYYESPIYCISNETCFTDKKQGLKAEITKKGIQFWSAKVPSQSVSKVNINWSNTPTEWKLAEEILNSWDAGVRWVRSSRSFWSKFQQTALCGVKFNPELTPCILPFDFTNYIN